MENKYSKDRENGMSSVQVSKNGINQQKVKVIVLYTFRSAAQSNSC